MAERSTARYLAPVALAICALALLLVLVTSSPNQQVAGEPARESKPVKEHSKGSAAKARAEKSEGSTSSEKRFYTVKSGDTPSAIADANGVSLEEIRKLNPDLDPQLLHPGMRIKLRS